jgi:formylglycine-generating enzyme required for sulfatase activity
MNRVAAILMLLVFVLIAAGEADKPATARALGNEKAFANSIGLKLVLIPAGKFTMGSPAGEKERDPDEQQHEVAITRPFYMGVYEVTQGEYEKVMRYNPSHFKIGPEHPVEQVRWKDAVDFCKKLSALPDEKKAGRVYRLPTEAEWEYACRAGTATAFHFGDPLSAKQANFNGDFPHGGGDKGPNLGKTAKVGSYQPNAFGLYDMHGNVWEWCSDWYDADYYKNSPKEDPQGPPKGVLPTGYHNDFYLVARGGCWIDEARGCRSAYRFRFMPSDPYRLVGFRVACAVPAPMP